RRGGKGELAVRHVEVREKAAQVAGRAGTRLAERRRVDPYENRRYPSRKRSPVACHVKPAACARPFARSSSRRSSASRIAAASAAALSGSARTAASPEASSSDGWEEATTGAPDAIASV